MDRDYGRCMGCGEWIRNYVSNCESVHEHAKGCRSRCCFRCGELLQSVTYDSHEEWHCPNCQGGWCETCGRKQLYSSWTDNFVGDLWHTCRVCKTATNTENGLRVPEGYKPLPSPVARTADDAILDAAINGNRILAMKLYREQYRVSLAEAKKFIEGL